MDENRTWGFIVHRYSVAALFGIALGIASAALIVVSPASADSILDDWPYYQPTYPAYLIGATLPGSPVGMAGGETYYSDVAEQDPWYTTTETNTLIPGLLETDNQQVTNVIDPSFGYPSVGTTYEESQLFPINTVIAGSEPLYFNQELSDPNLGSADYSSTFLNSFANLYVSDKAGIEDIVYAFGHSYTLFDFPLGGASAADVGDGLQQLMAEFGTSI